MAGTVLEDHHPCEVRVRDLCERDHRVVGGVIGHHGDHLLECRKAIRYDATTDGQAHLVRHLGLRPLEWMVDATELLDQVGPVEGHSNLGDFPVPDVEDVDPRHRDVAIL
jgi:hypothetical protein